LERLKREGGFERRGGGGQLLRGQEKIFLGEWEPIRRGERNDLAKGERLPGERESHEG